MDQILTRCKTRNDAWSSSVQGRIEYFGRDLHAADSMYHHSCEVNLKSKLLEHYGKSIFIAEGEGLSHIVTFREKTSEIISNYFNTPNGDDEETEKRAIIEAAAKLTKSDIKTIITPSVEEYPKSNDVTLECALEYVPAGFNICLLERTHANKKQVLAT